MFELQMLSLWWLFGRCFDQSHIIIWMWNVKISAEPIEWREKEWNSKRKTGDEPEWNRSAYISYFRTKIYSRDLNTHASLLYAGKRAIITHSLKRLAIFDGIHVWHAAAPASYNAGISHGPWRTCVCLYVFSYDIISLTKKNACMSKLLLARTYPI